MPVSKKRKKPEKKRRHDREQTVGAATPSAGAVEPVSGGGFLSRMRGGIQNVAGAGPRKKESLLSKILTWVLIAAALWFIARRFGILR